MSSQSTDVSVEHLDQDDLSCRTYSSGWERASISDDWESSSEYADDDDFTIQASERFEQPKSTGKPTLFDMEYKCELVVLANPYKNTYAEQKSVTMKEAEEIQEKPEDVPVATNPWKPMNTNSPPPEDPWDLAKWRKARQR